MIAELFAEEAGESTQPLADFEEVPEQPPTAVLRSGSRFGESRQTLPKKIGAAAILLCILCTTVVLGLEMTSEDPPSTQAMKLKGFAIIGMLASVATVVFCAAWHERLQPDDEEFEDMLSALFASEVIFQRGCLQVTGFALQVGGAIRVAIAMQNFSTGRAAVQGEMNGLTLVGKLDSWLGPGEVAVFWLDTPLLDEPEGSILFTWKCRVRSPGDILPHNGRKSLRVSKADPSAVRNEEDDISGDAVPTPGTNEALSMNRAGEFHTPVKPSESLATNASGAWAKFTLGKMWDADSAEQAAIAINDLLGRNVTLELVN